jgi:hypothetical protein
MIVVCQVLFNPGKPLVTAMALLFYHDNKLLEEGKAGSNVECWEAVLLYVGGRSCRL